VQSGIFPGTKFSTRVQLLESGVHRILVGTVCGTEAEGAESILLAGASDSDVDNGSEVYFTGVLSLLFLIYVITNVTSLPSPQSLSST
jgi:hypothetical protein